MINLRAIVSLDIGERIEQLYIYEGDEIDVLAEYFCQRHKITDQGKKYIIEEVNRQLTKKKRHVSILSDATREMAEKLVSGKLEIGAHQRLYSDAINQDKRLQTAIKEQQEHQLQVNTGRPQVNIRSRQISRGKIINEISVYERLYTDAKILEKKKIEKADNYFKLIHPFKPNRGKSSDQEQKKITIEQQKNHINRLVEEKNNFDKKNQLKRIKSQLLIDKKTGQEYFKPQIQQNRISRKVSEKIDKNDLELGYQIKKGLINLKSKSPQQLNINDPLLVEKIFNQLDSDRDGLISIQFVNFNVDPQLLKKLKPVITFLQENDNEIDLEYFFKILQLQKIKLI